MLKNCGPFRRKSLKSYVSRMSTGDSSILYDNHVARVLEQQGFVVDEHPRSIYEPEQLYTVLKRYATDWSRFEGVDAHLEFGFRMAFKIFARPKHSPRLSALRDQETVLQAIKLNKSAGLPSMRKKVDDLPYAFHREQQVRARLKAPNPCVAFKRTQEGNKTRLVWGYPFEMTLMESRFARPLIDEFLSRRTTMAFGMSKAELGSIIHRNIVDKPGTIVCLDYSKFDTTISQSMIRRAFSILATWFTDQDLEEFAWNQIVSYFIYTPIVMPDGNLYRGKGHGVPSGSYFTQLIDSIVNTALIFALQHKFQFNLDWRNLLVLGDDVIMNVNGSFDIVEWKQYLSTFGMKMNEEDTTIGEPHFLGAFWYRGKPDAPVGKLASKAVFPETFRNYQGKPREGAEQVLKSYARNYLSGFKLLQVPWHRNVFDVDSSSEIKNTAWLSGSDRYLLEEASLRNAEFTRKNGIQPLISMGFLK